MMTTTLVGRLINGRRKGFALVAVLSMIALALVTVVALLSVASNGMKHAGIEASITRARLTADSAVAVAVGQLRAATTREFEDGTPKPWTSQPGAIRVHRMDGQLEQLFKLYSAADMVAPTSADLANDVPADWNSRPAEFVDLNAPRIESANGSMRFPILDPRMKSTDPANSVEGFDYAATNAPQGVVDAAAGARAQRLPMPVRWLYMLRDGTLGTVDPGGRFVSAGGSAPSARNPIVSRFAFWVDDESCKININTAAEGAFWDTPFANTTQERALAGNQPTRLEYHRQPGHPAGVCLSSALLPNHRFHPAELASAEMHGRSKMLDMALDDARDLWRTGRLLVSELQSGTSFGGLEAPELFTANLPASQPGARQGRYASVSELLFDNAHRDQFPDTWGYASNDGRRTMHRFFQRHPQAIDRLARAGGVLTAESASPEETLFGTPRIAMFPVHATTPAPGAEAATLEGMGQRYSAYDRKMTLAATVGGQRYFVQRQEPGGGDKDFEIWAGGGNKKLFSYLQRLTDLPVPGFDRPRDGYASFAEKYGKGNDGDRDSILLLMLDYVRSANFADGHLKPDWQFSVLCPGEPHWGFGQVSALQQRVTGTAAQGTSDHPKGLGRLMSVSEVALMIACRAEVGTDRVIKGIPTTQNRSKLKNPGDRELEVGFVVEGFVPAGGWADYRPYASMTLVGGPPGTAPSRSASWPQMKINDILLQPQTSTSTIEATQTQGQGWKGWGGGIGVRALTKGVLMFRSIVVPAQADGTVPPLKFSGDSLGGNQLKLAVYDTAGSAAATTVGDLAQVVPLVFPDIEGDAIPLPSLPSENIALPLSGRFSNAVNSGKPLFSANDVVQSLVPLHGDYRLVAARRWAQSTAGAEAMPVFVPHPAWGLQRFAHCLLDSTITGATAPHGGSSLIPDLSTAGEAAPDFPLRVGAGSTDQVSIRSGASWRRMDVTNALALLRRDQGRRGDAWPHLTGDFDNGVGDSPDGAYVNRPDDGHWAAYAKKQTPYFSAGTSSQTLQTVPPVTLAGFCAQRLLPSPVMFGSLPTGARANVPWQTLLFRPQNAHHGAKSPPDHLFLDFFWSPVLEPEPVSLPFETQGRINVNFPMVPFHYIHRATALHAAMKAEALLAIPDAQAASYKNDGAPLTEKFRHYIDADATLKLWRERVFNQQGVFLSAGEICEHPLVPEGIEPSESAVESFWQAHRLTGDNSKERPYAHLHPRLTTRSNVFRVHFIAETIEKARSTEPGTVVADVDRATSRIQGSCLVRRQINRPESELPNYLEDPAAQPLHHFYAWRMGAIEEFR